VRFCIVNFSRKGFFMLMVVLGLKDVLIAIWQNGLLTVNLSIDYG